MDQLEHKITKKKYKKPSILMHTHIVFETALSNCCPAYDENNNLIYVCLNPDGTWSPK
ncbi:hypothetical protein PAECIP111802_00530 [Paenibacillus allorhizosphaerae]|uniref:Uncharacterized protein n=1 Tax=Paenibacillus allorhizosphaerae TaxID=2849866 RepID=A0ABN7THN1_9BACL|nr:hypothetical protein PAECIP111802_00530 [Paenibacillus allorhizosphaerae]